MDLPTYTNIWRIEKRLYKLYDFRLPMPLPINWIAVFAGITIPYIIFLIAIGLPFNHSLVWLYVLPPGLITWLTTRPVIENKRLPELLESQVRYLAEPRTWVRFAPLTEKEQMVVTARVWQSSRPAAGQAAETETETGVGEPATASQEAGGTQAPRTPGRASRPAPAGQQRSTAPGKQSRSRLSAAGLGGPRSAPLPAPARQVVPAPQPKRPRRAVPPTSVPATSALAVRAIPDVASPQPVQAPLPAVRRPSAADPRPAEGMPARARGGAPAGSRLEMSHDGPGRRPVMVVPPAQPVRPVLPGNPMGAWPAPARPLRRVPQETQAPQQEALPSEATLPSPTGQPSAATLSFAPAQLSEPIQPAAPALAFGPTPETFARLTSVPDAVQTDHQREPDYQPEPEADAEPEAAIQPEPEADAEPEAAIQPEAEVPAAAEAVPDPFYQREAAKSSPSRYQPDQAHEPEPPHRSEPIYQAVLERAHEPAPVSYSAAFGRPTPVDVPAGAAMPAMAELPLVSGWPADRSGPVTGDQPAVRPAPDAPDQSAQPSQVAQPPLAEQPSELIQPSQPVQPAQPMEPAQPTQPAQPMEPAQPQPAPATGVTASVEERRAVPSIERALSGPSRDRNLSWHGTVKIVTGTGGGAAQGPGARDQEALDRNRARLPVERPRRILVLGCTTGAGQTVTALMTGYMLASLREQPVAAVDLHDGTLARYRAPAAWLEEVLAGKPPQAARPARPDGPHPIPKANPARLDVIASHEPLGDGDEIKLAVQLNRYYPLTVLDGGPAGLAKLLKVTDQLVLVAPANVEAAGALADTRDWLDAHGHAELAMQSVTVINGVSRRSLPDVEQAEAIARGRSRAIVRVPWDDMLPVAATGPSTLRPQTRVAYTALAGVLVAGLAAAPATAAAPVRKVQ